MTLSKIEQNKKYLNLKQSAPKDSAGRERYYATTLNIREYKSLSVGTRLNVVYFDAPTFKSTLSFNIGAYYGRTPITTSTIDTSMNHSINTLTLFPELTSDTRADERWGLSLSWRISVMRLLSREVVQISDVIDPKNILATYFFRYQ
jgi:hypothetical protein